MYRPFTWDDILQKASSIKTYLSELIPDDTATESVIAFEESVPYIEESGQLGNISDLGYVDPQTLSTTYVVMLDTSCGPMLYYHQGDSRWGDFLYGENDCMSKYGCGPTAVSMVINSFSQTPVTPVDIAEWSYENGYYALHGGSYHGLIPDSLSAFGLQVESVTDYSQENVAELLSSGHILIALMGHGSLTASGHFVLFTKLLDNGNICIADPVNYENCTQEWDLDQLLSELKKSYDNGGPLWAVQP